MEEYWAPHGKKVKTIGELMERKWGQGTRLRGWAGAGAPLGVWIHPLTFSSGQRRGNCETPPVPLACIALHCSQSLKVILATGFWCQALPVSSWKEESSGWTDFQGARPSTLAVHSVGEHGTLIMRPPGDSVIPTGDGVIARRKPQHCK